MRQQSNVTVNDPRAAQKPELGTHDDAQEVWKKSEHQKLVEYFHLLGPTGRAAKLKDCYAGLGVQNDCTGMIQLELEAADSEEEKIKLVALNESLLHQAGQSSRSTGRTSGDSSSISGGGDSALLCCDGTESPSCTCNGPHRGCCSHHHGICGCEKP